MSNKGAALANAIPRKTDDKKMATQPLDTILEVLHPLDQKRILDAGCGGGLLSKALSSHGATLVGIDPDASSVDLAARTAPQALFLRSGAERLPFAATTFDAAIFLNSLHHVPVDLMSEALAEAARVLRPASRLVVVEPLPEGSFFDSFKMIEDETIVRAAAQAALNAATHALPLSLESVRTLFRNELFRDLDQFVQRIVQVDARRMAVVIQKRAELEAAFFQHAKATPKGYSLDQPLRAHIFVKIAA
jgi:SAM-dependent methyltransferase